VRRWSKRSARLAVAGFAIVTCACVTILTGANPGLTGTSRALGQSPGTEVTAQADAAVPAHDVLLLGSSPSETAGETWGLGEIGAQSAAKWALTRYTPASGWTLAPTVTEASGSPLGGFEPGDGNLPGSITPDGTGALLGQVPVEEHEARQLLLVRSPGQETFSEAASETTKEPPLEEGEKLFDPGERRAPMVAALEEAGGSSGALVLPVVTNSSKEETSVLHWSGATRAWTVEPIEVPQTILENGSFRVLAIAASPASEGAPSEAWLLAQLESQSETVALFHREESGGSEVWQPVAVSGGEPGAPLSVPLAEGQSTPYTLPGIAEMPSNQSQLLTASARGVWIDGERADDRQPVTMFFKPEGRNAGSVLASWCGAVSTIACTHTIAGGLPTGESRSFAWAGSSTYGERVISGLNEGVSLRLEGEEFRRVLALGSSAAYDVGGSRGAAFSDATDGWLGSERLPVHLTVTPEENLLQNYPVPFRHPLVAIASQPGVSVGALSSEAVAVGEEGEVARYKPGAGWQPESLLNSAGVRQTPHLRAVAWPAPHRVYAVGTNPEGNEGQIWLWRAETNLWERDPATPINFRGKLLGIAFDPEDASRGYAVGQGGVLLRYGKTWTQEPVCEEGVSGSCLPGELANASFTSIAFAGSEAIVAYRVPHFTYNGSSSVFSYTGGLLINNGSGWQVDTSAASALGVEAQDIPWAVAALPDGGAAISAESAAGVAHVFERNSPGASWEATAQPYPGYNAPGVLAIFREGGALRVIGSGAVPNTAHEDEQTEAPAGFPPPLVKRYPLAEPPVFIFRQTSSGWSEEEHDHDEVGPPSGNYTHYDKGYEPDPIWAVLTSSTGTEGWGVGGFPRGEGEAGYETSDIARYAFPHAETTPPTGVGSSTVPVEPGKALFAIGGGAQCAGPCAARADARIGPDTWLSTALKRANAIGVRDFLFTGPRVTSGQTLVKATLEIPYEEEFARYAQLLAGGEGTPVYAAASPADYVNGGECLFEETFAQFFETAKGRCGSGHDAYYAVPAPISASAGGRVRALVLDDVGGVVGAAQLEWLRAELSVAEKDGEPAIVVGDADLNAEEEHHEGEAAAIVQAIVTGRAAAYFFDAPEQNLKLHLRGSKIPAFGSGTLGYVNVQDAEEPEFVGASGFLLVEVGAYETQPEAGAGHAQVEADLIPVIGQGEHGEGELALEAQQGTLLRRSQVAMFSGLARRPRAGNEGNGESETESLSYVFTPIPANCVGAICPPSGPGLLPEYSFTSSNEEVGRFVQQELRSSEADAVKFNSKEEPVFEEGKRNGGGLVESASGLFCALNKGETDVTINAGGLSATLKVIVEAGSVRRPCGTVPVKHPATTEPQVAAPTPPPVTPTAAVAPASAPPVLPLPPVPVATPAPPVRPPARTPPPFFIQPALPALLVPFLPPPLVEPANPTPPSGTSAVTSPVEAAQKEEEHEEATESVSNQAVAYRAHEHEPSPAYLLGIILLAAFAGASAFRRPGRGRREVRVAPATISGSRLQRRMEDRRRGR
jgi:hypothetical protein